MRFVENRLVVAENHQIVEVQTAVGSHPIVAELAVELTAVGNHRFVVLAYYKLAVAPLAVGNHHLVEVLVLACSCG